jgi:probable HAF family extracellular repeat protein
MRRTNTWEHLLRLARGPRGTAARQPNRRPPPRRLCLESLEDRNLLSSYTITVIGPGNPNEPNAINNAAVAQVVGMNANNHAYLWDSVHGMQDLGTVLHDTYSLASGINDAGQVVGRSSTLTYNRKGSPALTSEHAFLWTSSKGLQNIGNGYAASGINAAGEVSGTVNFDQSGAAGGLWNGKWTSLAGVPPLQGINSYGQAFGYSYSSGVQQAFLWTPATAGGTTGTLEDLGTFGGANSRAGGINGQGYVTGSAELPRGSYLDHAFVWRPASPNGTSGTLTDLDPGGTGSSGGGAINSGGVVAGNSDDNNAGKDFAALWQPGGSGYTMSDLNSLVPAGTGWDLQYARAINDSGQIVVKATNASLSGWYDLLLTPSTPAAPAQGAALTQTSAVLASALATAGPLRPAAAGGALMVSMQAAPPALSTGGSRLPSGPSSTEVGGLLQSASAPGPSHHISGAVARHALGQVYADQDGTLGGPWEVDLAAGPSHRP